MEPANPCSASVTVEHVTSAATLSLCCVTEDQHNTHCQLGLIYLCKELELIAVYNNRPFIGRAE